MSTENEKVKKLVEYEKKEHGKIPSPEEEKKEHEGEEKSKKSMHKAEQGPPAPSMDEEKEKDEEEKEETEKCNKAKKSVDLTGEDLEKSIQKLESLVQANDSTSRKDALLAKAQHGDELSKSERSELFALLGGDTKPEATVSDNLVKGLKENEPLQKALDVSDYLREQHTELCKSLVDLGEVVEKSDARQHEFNLVLAKAVADVGNLVKAVAENVGTIATQPARPPKSVGVAPGRVLQKSFGASPGGEEEQLSKGEILDTLGAMLEKSETGMGKNGEDLLMAISKYEQMNRMSPSLLSEVKAFRSSVTH